MVVAVHIDVGPGILQALAEPFAYETYRQQRIEAKLDAQREGRISLVRKLPKVSL